MDDTGKLLGIRLTGCSWNANFPCNGTKYKYSNDTHTMESALSVNGLQVVIIIITSPLHHCIRIR